MWMCVGESRGDAACVHLRMEEWVCEDRAFGEGVSVNPWPLQATQWGCVVPSARGPPQGRPHSPLRGELCSPNKATWD